MVVMNIPGRAEWVPGLQKVLPDAPDVFIGSLHHCQFEEYESILSPINMTFSDEKIVYAESCELKGLNIRMIFEYIFQKKMKKTVIFYAVF